MNWRLLLSALLFLFFFYSSVVEVRAQTINWIDQFGTATFDEAKAITYDTQGSFYVVGFTNGSLPGQTNLSDRKDVFLRKYSNNREVVWTRQFSSGVYPDDDEGWGVAVDFSGNVLVVGKTTGVFPGFSSSVAPGAFVRKYDPSGNLLWTDQYNSGLPGNETDRLDDVTTDNSGNIYVVGYKRGGFGHDAIVRKYNPVGQIIWTRVFGFSGVHDFAHDITIDGHGYIYVAGIAYGSLSGQPYLGAGDVFIRKYDQDGNELLTIEDGSTGNDSPAYVAVADNGDIYLTGSTNGILPGLTSKGLGNGTSNDVFVIKYNNYGQKQWSRQFGGYFNDLSSGIVVNSNDQIYVSGWTNGDLTGFSGENQSQIDGFVRKFDSNGSTLWTRQIGNGYLTKAEGITLKDGGAIYIAGTVVYGSLQNQFWFGESDVFVAELSDTNTNIFAPPDPQPLGSEISLSGIFTDPEGFTAHNAVWYWGDGSSSQGVIDEQTGVITGDHLYATTGVYSISLILQAIGESYSDQASYEYIVVYDPDGGSVRGSGTIESPLGSFVQDTSLFGEARFGFNSRYAHGANVPSGRTAFTFRLADFKFVSTSYDWLVVAGAKAQYKGSGQVNSQGDYGFMLTGIDGSRPGGGGSDKFRLKIWDKVSGNIVYDNQLDSPDPQDPTTILSRGSITIRE